uniref:Uncharacterized protein n=1 Tax=Anguilla anguilla TaxID=7936 RepID=A0A0E9U4R6_ANGAN
MYILYKRVTPTSVFY